MIDAFQWLAILGLLITVLVQSGKRSDFAPLDDRPVTRKQIDQIFEDMGFTVLWFSGAITGSLEEKYLPIDIRLKLVSPKEPIAEMLLDHLKLEIAHQPDKVIRRRGKR